MFKAHEINVNARGHGLDLGDRVRGTVRIDVEDPERFQKVLALYQEADQQADAILKQPTAGTPSNAD